MTNDLEFEKRMKFGGHSFWTGLLKVYDLSNSFTVKLMRERLEKHFDYIKKDDKVGKIMLGSIRSVTSKPDHPAQLLMKTNLGDLSNGELADILEDRGM